MSDYQAERDIKRDINEGVRWCLMASYGYYVKGSPIMSDESFDKLAVVLAPAPLFGREATQND